MDRQRPPHPSLLPPGEKGLCRSLREDLQVKSSYERMSQVSSFATVVATEISTIGQSLNVSTSVSRNAEGAMRTNSFGHKYMPELRRIYRL